jgi:pimeloyl-ACP methyl ester carboxylesterase
MTTTSAIRHRTVQTNGINMHIAEAGEGPLVLLLHGFPDSWYCWRHQLAALAGAGFHAVAPDQRGYGQTDRPEPIEQYTMLHLVGDIVGLLDALGEGQAVVVGHDWGGPVAWNTAVMRPDRVRGVVGMSVPYSMRGPFPPVQGMRMAIGERFYIVYFQQPGVAEANLERDVRANMRRALVGASGDAAPGQEWNPVLPKDGFMEAVSEPETLPAWLTEADVDFYTQEFERTGFRGGLNWYRNMDRSWELMAAYSGAKVTPPALFIAGTKDAVMSFPGMSDVVKNLQGSVPNLRRTLLIEGAGHWVQQERPEEVNAALLEFLRGL